jgi:hypothetical protein
LLSLVSPNDFHMLLNRCASSILKTEGSTSVI